MPATSEALLMSDIPEKQPPSENAKPDVVEQMKHRLTVSNIPVPEPPKQMLSRFSLNGSFAELKEALELITQAIDWISWELGVAEGEKSNLAQRVKDKSERAFLTVEKTEGTEKYRLFKAQRQAADLEEQYEESAKKVFILNRRLQSLKEQKDSIQSIWWVKKAGLI